MGTTTGMVGWLLVLSFVVKSNEFRRKLPPPRPQRSQEEGRPAPNMPGAVFKGHSETSPCREDML